jgi:menaquinone-dependent protoporphyrinogen oxidase
MAGDPIDLPEVRRATRAREHRLFAGKLEKRNVGLAQRAALLVMRGLEGDYRDWAQIEGWASGIAQALRTGSGNGDPR